MRRETIIGLFSVLLIVSGCQEDSDSRGGGFDSPVAASRLDPSDPTILRRPFTADQIRDEFGVGLVIDIHQRTPEKESVERWTVISADAEGVVIAYAELDGNGVPADEAQLRRSTWVELRDHATFPAATATREAVTRDTPLGSLEGWVYTVPDEETGSVSEMFFARDHPGAPVTMRTTLGDEVLMEMSQTVRHRPES